MPSSTSGFAAIIALFSLASFLTVVPQLRSSLDIVNQNDFFIIGVPTPRSHRASDEVSRKRMFLEAQCANDTVTDEDYRKAVLDLFHPPKEPIENHPPADPLASLRPCPFVFMDLGANIGDSLGKFIDSDLPTCKSKFYGFPRYHVNSGIVERRYRVGLNALSVFAQQHRMATPENYCHVGVEGNPLFTERLQQLQQRVMHSTPRPVRRTQFLTETVLVDKDGPTVFYLDTVNAKINFVGSSVLESHVDVQRSASKNNATKVEAHVQGISLSTLLDRTIDSRTKHVLVKMDIEGAEYDVLNEARDKICQVIASGVKMDMMLELHNQDLVGEASQAMITFKEKTWKSLLDCGLVMNDGKDGG